MEDLFAETTFGQIALGKLAPVDQGFMLYEAGWLGENNKRDVMEVIGATFREAKSGPRKGQHCVKVKGTERRAYVTAGEMKTFDKARAEKARDEE